MFANMNFSRVQVWPVGIDPLFAVWIFLSSERFLPCPPQTEPNLWGSLQAQHQLSGLRGAGLSGDRQRKKGWRRGWVSSCHFQIPLHIQFIKKLKPESWVLKQDVDIEFSNEAVREWTWGRQWSSWGGGWCRGGWVRSLAVSREKAWFWFLSIHKGCHEQTGSSFGPSEDQVPESCDFLCQDIEFLLRDRNWGSVGFPKGRSEFSLIADEKGPWVYWSVRCGP